MEDGLGSYLIDRKNDIKLIEVKKRLLSLKPTKDFILSVVGPRRAGKTYLLYHFIKTKKIRDDSYLFVNFEEIESKLESLIAKHQEIYAKNPEFLFLDEIQNLQHWQREVYKLYERKRFCIFLTGSSSKFLSKEIATQLRGRSLTIRVFPLSFKEVLLINGLNKKVYSSEDIGKIKNLLRSCIKKGSFPDIALARIEPSRFISEYIDLVIYKDIMERYGVKNRLALEFFIKSAIASNSHVFSVNKVYNTMKSMQIKVGKNTLYNFQKFLEDVNVIFFLKKYSESIKKSELSLPKAYVVDNGLYSFTTYRHNVSPLMESFVFQELLKRGYEPNKNIYYFGNGYEVDFVLLDREKVRQLVQVCCDLSDFNTRQREIKSLLKASKELKCNDLLVITWEHEAEEQFKEKQIKFLPLWKWLRAHQ